jgi:hypothetical protein
MIVVAGPPGSGKTRYFPTAAFGGDSFNIDDRHADPRELPRDSQRRASRRRALPREHPCNAPRSQPCSHRRS